MNKFSFYFILSIVATVFFSCSPDANNNQVSIPLNDYNEQFKIDNGLIEDYLKNYYIKFDDGSVSFSTPNFADKVFSFEKIPVGGTQPSLYSFLNNKGFPRLVSRTFYVNSIAQNAYFLILREGVKDRPTNLDGVYAEYKGQLLNNNVFDSFSDPEKLYNLDASSKNGGLGVVRGWSECFPFLKTGKATLKPNGNFEYSDFGVGVMFLPSVLGYYQSSLISSTNVGVPSYSPLIFTVKLLGVLRYDHDNDGIPTYLEDLNNDSYINNNSSFFAPSAVNPDDTDKDGIANYLDLDDDGDGINTLTEITNPETNLIFDFNLIPGCDGKNTDPLRIKRHLIKCP